MSNSHTQNDEILRYLIDVYNDLYTESGQIKGTVANTSNLTNIFKRELPRGLERSGGLIRLTPELHKMGEHIEV